MIEKLQENKDKKGNLGFASNFENVNHHIPESNLAFFSSLPHSNLTLFDFHRNLLYHFAAPLNFEDTSFVFDRNQKKNAKQKVHFPMAFVEYQGEHENYKLLYDQMNQNTLSLSTLSFSIPRVLFDFFGGSFKCCENSFAISFVILHCIFARSSIIVIITTIIIKS